MLTYCGDVMPLMNGILISYCGIACTYCPAYRRGLCSGCDVHEDECEYIKCAKKRGVKFCFQCEKFPCKLYKEGFEWVTEEYGRLRWKPYSDAFIMIMEKIK